MACPPSVKPHTNPTLEIMPITVNGELIAESAIAQEIQHHPSDNLDEALHQASNALVLQSLLRQKARALGLLSEAETDAAAEEAAIATLLQQEAVSPEATEAECERYFVANRNRFTTSPLLEISHILLAAAPDDIKARMELKTQAQELIALLQQQPERMPELARELSACPSKATGGSLGQVSRGQTVAEFERVVFNFEAGIAAHPVETRYGIHVVQVHRRLDGQQLDFDGVADRVRQYLNERSQRKAISQYLQLLLSDADIEGFTPQISGSPLLQ